jgi:menaquinone-dependent protoporphyrinogen oxidase
MKKTLIAYISKSGATQEAASEIAGVLRDKFRLEVDLVDLKKTPSPELEQYNNIIIGSGVRIQKLYKEFFNFLERDLKDKKVAIFISSLEPRSEAIEKYIKPTLKEYPDVKPFEIEVFGGIMKILWTTVQDKRDKKKAQAWAEKIGKKIKLSF